MSAIDYSKWNNIYDSSDEDEDEVSSDSHLTCDTRCTKHEHIECEKHHRETITSQQIKKNSKCLIERSKFVKIHPDDNCEGLSDVFLTDPEKFIPFVNCFDENAIFQWGLPTRHEDLMTSIYRKINTQNLYCNGSEEFVDTPEVQFVKQLIKQREKYFAKRKLDPAINQNLKRDYIINIKLIETFPSVWRRFKVSGTL